MPRTRTRIWVAAATAALLAVTTGLAAPGDPKTFLVSVQSQSSGGDGANADSQSPSVSGDGRIVAFETLADNLGGPIDTPGAANVYVYDRDRRKAELISRRSNNGPGADDISTAPEISANGRFVAFVTQADNLGGPLDTNVDNIYVYDRQRDRVQFVSRRSGATGVGADASSFDPAVSADGRFVAFLTDADNLGGPLDTDVTNAYVYDRERKKVQLVSRRSGATGAGANDFSEDLSISGNGRHVAFATGATNLGGPTDAASSVNVYVYDREQRRVQLVSRRSRAAGGAGANDNSTDPDLSATGRFVGFESNATNLGGPNQADPGDDSLYVYDRRRRRVELVSRRSQAAGGAIANDDSDDPSLSGNGRFVAFETNATNLGGPIANNPSDPDFEDNVYVYDRERNRVALVGRASGRNGEACGADCQNPDSSTSGRFIVFEADATNLGGPIAGGVEEHIYLRDRGR